MAVYARISVHFYICSRLIKLVIQCEFPWFVTRTHCTMKWQKRNVVLIKQYRFYTIVHKLARCILARCSFHYFLFVFSLFFRSFILCKMMLVLGFFIRCVRFSLCRYDSVEYCVHSHLEDNEWQRHLYDVLIRPTTNETTFQMKNNKWKLHQTVIIKQVNNNAK